MLLDRDGDGDARTFDEALALVEDGGTVIVRSGHYPGAIRISRALTVIGDPDPHLQPVIDRLIVLGGARLTLEGLRIEGVDAVSTITVQSGSLTLRDCTVINRSKSAADGMTSSLYAYGGQVRVEGGTLGPGGDSSVIAAKDARVSLVHVTIVGGTGYGIYGAGSARIDTSGSRITGRFPVAVGGEVNLDLTGNDIRGWAAEPEVVVSDRATAEIVNNSFSLVDAGARRPGPQRNWLRIAPTAVRARISGNTSGTGKPLSLREGPHRGT